MTRTMQRIALASRPTGAPTPDNFRLETLPMPAPGAGEALVEVLWLSLDPYMRGRMDDAKSYAKPVALGDTMEGGCVARVLESGIDGLSPGEIVNGQFGWASHAVIAKGTYRKVDPAIAPISTALGVLGMPGMTAWHGLTRIGAPKAGETLAVGAATGAVGSLVGQLAKARGMRAVGIAGGADKCAFATEELGFDACVDHRGKDAKALREALSAAAPDGVDVYFENVGSTTLEAVLPLMNVHGRIPLCGMIGWYSGADAGGLIAPKLWRSILVNRLKVQGFIIFDHWDAFPEFLKEVAPMVADGRIRYRETVAEGLEHAPAAFMQMLKGGNFGKQLVRVAAE